LRRGTRAEEVEVEERRQRLAEAQRLREDNDDLPERLAYANREIERLRAWPRRG
jgi:hypothetical protein